MSEEDQSKHSHLSQRVEEEVQKSINANLRLYKIAIVSFLAGFALFITIGLLTKGELFKVIVKSIYPPGEIYADVVDQFLKDEDFKTQLINRTNYGEVVIPGATLQTFPGLNNQLPGAVWETVSTGKEEDYGKMLSRPEFFNALIKYHTDLSRSFLLPTSSKRERAHRILEIGRIPLNAQLLMAGSHLDGNATAHCFKTFRDQELQAIIVIPESATPEEYSWFNCAFGWPEITLEINGVDGIRLVGVRRNGRTNRLIILLSQKSAERMALPGWESHNANSYGKVTITSAE